MRWLRRVLVLVLVLIVSLGVYGFLVVRRSFPQIEAWADGIQYPMRWTEEQVALDPEGTLTLVPGSG